LSEKNSVNETLEGHGENLTIGGNSYGGSFRQELKEVFRRKRS